MMISTTQKTPKLAVFGLLVSAVLGLTACQSTPTTPVIQRADSTYETTGIGKTKVEAKQSALTSANQTCGMRQAIIIEDELRYNGVLDEKMGRMIDQVGSVAGSIFGTGKPNLARDDDFEYEISFRCQ